MKRKTAIRIVVCVCAAYAWWGVLYPELTLTPDTYAVLDEYGAVHSRQNMVEWDLDGGFYRTLLETDSSKIQFKSKLMAQIDDWLEKIR